MVVLIDHQTPHYNTSSPSKTLVKIKKISPPLKASANLFVYISLCIPSF